MTWLAVIFPRANVDFGSGNQRSIRMLKEETIMKFSSISVRRKFVGICAGGVIGGFAAATIAAPIAFTLLVNWIAFTLLFLYFLARRAEIARLEDSHAG